MAIAKAICMCKTCGKKFEMTTSKRNRAAAEEWEKSAPDYYNECSDCWKARRDAENEAADKAAAEENKALGLPCLTGTEKQIAWSEKIRSDFFLKWADWTGMIIKAAKSQEMTPEIQKKLDEMILVEEWLKNQSEAKWWINHLEILDRGARHVFHRFGEEILTETMKKKVGYEAPKPEIVEPENKKHDVVCTVAITKESVTVNSKYDPDMPEIVKSLGYKWDAIGRIWKKAIDYRLPSIEDAAAEVANKLLVAGFSVIIPPEVKEKAVSGTYTPEHRRWIFLWKSGDLGVSGDIKPKGIPGDRNGRIPISAFDAVEEFARLNDYRISPDALEAIDNYKARVTKVEVTAGQNPEYQDKTGEIKNILASSREVLADLKEDD